MNNKQTYHRLIERIIPFASIIFNYKDIIEQIVEIQNLQTMLLKKGASENKFNDLKEEAKKLALSSRESYYDILKDLVNKELLKLTR